VVVGSLSAEENPIKKNNFKKKKAASGYEKQMYYRPSDGPNSAREKMNVPH
jgi:hypothetical protein